MDMSDFAGLDFDDESRSVDQIVATAANRAEFGLPSTESPGDRARSILRRLGAHNVDDAMKLLNVESVDPAALGDVIWRFRTEHPHFFRSRPTSSGDRANSVEELAADVARELTAGVLPVRGDR